MLILFTDKEVEEDLANSFDLVVDLSQQINKVMIEFVNSDFSETTLNILLHQFIDGLYDQCGDENNRVWCFFDSPLATSVTTIISKWFPTTAISFIRHNEKTYYWTDLC